MSKHKKDAAFLFDSFREKKEALLHFIKLAENEEYSNKDLKTLRVSVKKMRAIFLLLSLANEPFKAKNHLKSIKSLFKKAGKIREHLVNQDLLANYWLSRQSAVLLENKIKAQIKKDRKRLKKTVVHSDTSELEKTTHKVKLLCSATPVAQLRVEARHFIAGKLQQIQHLTVQEIGTQELHNIRRHLRVITSLAYLFNENGLPIMPKMRLKHLKKLQGMLGDWHDREILIDFDKEILADLTSQRIGEEWGSLKQKMQAENLVLEKIIKKELRAI